MSVPRLLEELLRATAPSGTEEAVAAIVRREAVAFGAGVEADAICNTVARVAGAPGGRTVALLAHADEVGGIVTHVDEEGMLTVGPIGQLRATALLGQRVVVLGRAGPVPGRVTRVGSGDVEWVQLRVDIGTSGRDEAAAIVEPGDGLVWLGEPMPLAGRRVMSKSLDNRAGVYVMLEALRRLAAAPAAWDVALVVNAMEEGPLDAGAVNAVRVVAPDAAVVADVTFAADELGADPATWGKTSLGGGPSIFRGPVAHPAVVAGMRAAAETAGLPYALEAGKSSWSDADDVQAALAGIPTGIVAVPVRYMHTPSEVADLGDIEGAIALVEAYVRSLALDLSFVR